MASRTATLVFVALGMLANAGWSQAPASSADEALLLALSRLARAGASQICDRVVLETTLGIRIGSLLQSSGGDPPQQWQWTDQVTHAPGSPPIKQGRYQRTRAGTEGGCELRIDYEQFQVCDAPAGRVKGLIGADPVPGPARPHGSVYGYEYGFMAASGHKTLLRLGTSEGPCTSSFGLSAAAAVADVPAYPWMRPGGNVDYAQLPRRPQRGDKLGRPKAQSAGMLPADARALLDAALRLYSEEGLFLDEAKTLELLGTQVRDRHMLTQEQRVVGYTALFAPTGVFARPGWSGYRTYVWPGPKIAKGRIDVVVRGATGGGCVDSRAVEGYLDLELDPGLEQVPPVPPERWDRHGVFGRPYARPLSARTPGMAIYFSGGCLSGLDIGMQVLEVEQVR